MPLHMCFATVVQRSPHSIWSQLRSHLILPESEHWLIVVAQEFLLSSESWKGGSSLDLTLSRMLAREICQLLTHLVEGRDSELTRFVTSNMTQLRHLHCWVNRVYLHLHYILKIPKAIFLEMLENRPWIVNSILTNPGSLLEWVYSITSSHLSIGDRCRLIKSCLLRYSTVPPEVVVRASRDLPKLGQNVSAALLAPDNKNTNLHHSPSLLYPYISNKSYKPPMIVDINNESISSLLSIVPQKRP